jgi:hypothetical protein
MPVTMPVTFILLDTHEYNTIRVPTQFLIYLDALHASEMRTTRKVRDAERRPSLYSRSSLSSSLLKLDSSLITPNADVRSRLDWYVTDAKM